jgi:hypothetical protein
LHTTRRRSSAARRRSQLGQSLAEFALIIPILLIILVGVADLGRVFNAGVVLEASARNAAEHAAQKYLADPPGDTSLEAAVRLAAPASGSSAYYGALRDDAARAACAEMRGQTNTDYVGGSCATWPVVAVCIHDNADPNCGGTAAGFAAIPPECTELLSGWSNASGASGERWVEVRTCYRFTSLLRLPIFDFGDIYLQRARSFVIPCYFATGYGPCG